MKCKATTLFFVALTVPALVLGVCVRAMPEQEIVGTLHACRSVLPKALEGLSWYEEHDPRGIRGIDAEALEREHEREPASLVTVEVLRYRPKAGAEKPHARTRWRRPKRLRLQTYHLVGSRCDDVDVGAAVRLEEDFFCCDEGLNPDLRCYTFPSLVAKVVEGGAA